MNSHQVTLEHLWIDASKAARRSIVFPESSEPRTLRAIAKMIDDSVCGKIVLIGSVDETRRALADDPSTWRTVESGVCWSHELVPDLEALTAEVLRRNAEARGKHPLTDNDRKKFGSQQADPLYQAGALVAAGHVDSALAGAIATTSAVIRAAISTTGLAPGLKSVSGSFIMERPGRGKPEAIRSTMEQPDSSSSDRSDQPAAILFADAGVIVEPTVDQLVDIAVASVETWSKLVLKSGFGSSGVEPVVSFLSFSTRGSADHPAARKMAEAATRFKRRHPTILADGELQFDAAWLPEIAERKCPDSPVAGRANIFIFPDLGAGNIAYKITQRLGGFHAYGPILQGLARPYSDLSRGSTSHDIFMSALLNLLRV